MKKLLLALIVFTFGISSLYPECRVWMNDDGTVNATTDDGELWQWSKLPYLYQEFCINDTCGSEPSNKWSNLTKNEKAICSLYLCDNSSDLTYSQKTICNSPEIQPIKENAVKTLKKDAAKMYWIKKQAIIDAAEREKAEAEGNEMRDKIIVFSPIIFIGGIFVLVLISAASFKKISRKKINDILQNTVNKTEAIDRIKNLLRLYGYVDTPEKPYELYYRKRSSICWWCKDEVRIDYSRFKTIIQEEEKDKKRKTEDKKSSLSSIKIEKKSEVFLEPKIEKTPLQKTLPFIKKGFLGSIVIVVILSFGNKGEGELPVMFITLMGTLVILSFFIWFFFYINDNRFTQEIKKKAKQTTANILDTKPKPKDVKDTADVVLKYHDMLQKGIITQEEFDDIKKDLLSRNT